MIALSVSGLSLSFGADTILRDLSFSIQDGERVGIIGVNGAGKTSLLRLIAGEYEPSAGALFLQKGHTTGLLQQNADLCALPGEMTMADYMYTAFPALLALEAQIADVQKKADAAGTLADLHARYNAAGGLQFRSRCRATLLRLGFTEEQIGQKIRTLSGGQYTKLALARLLATEPDILMLDEPTNHLDLDALGWLEGFLSSYKRTVLIVSHDRYFLDRTTNRTLQIQFGSAKLYPGAYTRAKEQMEADRAALEKRYREQQKEIARIRANIDFQRRCNREHNFVTIRSKEKQLARMEKIELTPAAQRTVRMRFRAEEESAGEVLRVRDVCFGYDGVLIKNLSFLVKKGERVLVLGPNGCGKSTLMKLICGKLSPISGVIEPGYNIKIGYYDQENRGLSENKSVMEEMHDAYPMMKDGELRSVLALFLFGAEDIIKPVRVLSGGERARLTLAKLILKKVNLLVMDEPTNHLDIGSCEALESALNAFDGTVIAVSHDRYFIDRVATRILELCPGQPRGMIDYPLEEYDDAYTEYLRIKETVQSQSKPQPPKETSTAKEDYAARKREEADRRRAQRVRRQAQERITQLETRIEQIDNLLAAEAGRDYVQAIALTEEKDAAEEELLGLYETVMG